MPLYNIMSSNRMGKEKVIQRLVVIFFCLLGLGVLILLGIRNGFLLGKTSTINLGLQLPAVTKVTSFSLAQNKTLRIPSQIIKAERTRLSVALPFSDLANIKAILKFKKGPKEVKLGIRGNEKDRFIYKPLYLSLLQDLNRDTTDSGALVFWQRSREYKTVNDFVNNLPSGKVVATYNLDRTDPFTLPLPKTSLTGKDETLINQELRGSHTLFMRVGHTPLTIEVMKHDANLYEGADELDMTVRRDGKSLVQKTIPDDGILDNNGLKMPEQKETIVINNIALGIYQLDLTDKSAGADVRIDQIKMNQSDAVFQKQVFLTGDEPSTLWTNAKAVTISTYEHTPLQTINFNSQYNLQIKDSQFNYGFNFDSTPGKKNTGALYKIVSPKNDLVLRGDGYFSFSEASFFDPDFFRSTDLGSFDSLDGVDFILANYQPVKKDGEWLLAEAEFDPKTIKLDPQNKLYFSLDVSGFATSPAELEIGSFEIQVNSQGVLSKTIPPKFDPVGAMQKAVNAFWQKVVSFFPKPPSKSKPTSQTVSPKPPAAATKSATVIAPGTMVRVLNGGAESSAAKKFSDRLKAIGFSNISTGNADKIYKDAIIFFRTPDKTSMEKILKLLVADYKNISQKENATSSAELLVILGQK